MLRPVLLACSCALGCAGATQTPPPAHEAPAEPLPPPSSATLTPAAGVTSLALPCGPTEHDNGVDDDCDGHIDEGASGQEASLELALTWTGPAGLGLHTQPALAALEAPDCTPDEACTLRLSSPDWQREPLALQVVRSETPTEPDALTASLCVAAHGTSLGCHNFTLAPGQTREVAKLTVP